MALYENDASNTLPAFGEAGDSIVNIGFIVTGDSEGDLVTLYTGANVTIDAGDGADTINNGGVNASIVGGEDDDLIVNSSLGTGSKLDGGAGNDYVSNTAASVNAILGNGDDTVYNSGESTTIIGGLGDDSITNYASRVIINTGDGHDVIDNYYYTGVEVTINAGDGDDWIKNEGARAIIDTGNGKDTVRIGWGGGGDYSTIKTGAGNDSVGNAMGSNVSIDAGDDNDYIGSGGSKVTVSGGNGNDTISNGSEGHNSILLGGTGDDLIENRGQQVTLNGGDGDDTINNYNYIINYNGGRYDASLTAIDGGIGDDRINNDSREVTINGGDDNDTISNSGSSSSISGGEGEDSISNSGTYVKIYGRDGDDSIGNTAQTVTINGGKGNDVISNTAATVTIEAGYGNDTISLGSDAANNVILYYTDEGNDLIQGFNATTTLRIDDGEGEFTTLKSGDDVIVKVGSNLLTLSGAANLSAINIEGEDSGEIISTTMTLTNGSAAQVTLDSFVQVATASKRTTSIAITGNSLANSIVGGKAADTLWGGTGNDTLTGGWGADTFVYTGDNDVITDYGANFDKVSLAGDGAKWLSHITGVNVDGSDVKLTFSKNSSKTLTLLNTANKKVIVNGVTRIFGDNVISTGDKKSATLTSAFSGTFDASGYSTVNASAATQAVTISGTNSIVGGSKADSIVGTTGNDTLKGGYGADTFVYTGGQDVITDYAANFDKIQLNGTGAKWLSHITGATVDGNNNVTLTFSNDSSKTLTINGAAGKKVIVNNTTLIFEDGIIYNYNKSKSTIAGGSADVYWFDESNFDAPGLDSIMQSPATDYSVGKIETLDNLTKLSKDEFTLTFGNDK